MGRAVSFATIALPLCLVAEQLPIRSYTAADGLAGDRVDCIVPDSRGFVWFCTPEGLTRFDGYRMVTFGTREGLPDRAIHAFLETRSGAYLVGTRHGLSQFNAAAGARGFVTYREGSIPLGKPIFSLLESASGTIWCGASGRLLEALSTGTVGPVKWSAPEGVWITDIKEDSAGKLWVATNAGIYVLGKNAGVQHIAQDRGLPDPWVNKLLLDRAGELWAGTRDGLALMGDSSAAAGSWVRQIYTEQDGLPNHDVIAMAEAADGALWISTKVGISVLESGSRIIRNLTRENGLTDIVINALAADNFGNIWAGTQGAGVMRISSGGFVTFRERDGLVNDQVQGILSDRTGKLIVVNHPAAELGRWLSVFDPAHRRFHAIVPKVLGESASWARNQFLLEGRTGEWWAATKAGLCRFAPMGVEDLANREPRCYARDLGVFTVLEDSKGGIWAAAQSEAGDRLVRWDPARNAISWFEDGPTRHELVNAFAEDRYGNVWMGLYGGGAVYRYDGRRFARYGRRDGVPTGSVSAILPDRAGRLWIGSSNGLAEIDNPSGSPLRARTYDVSSGLASDTILCLVEDEMGRIYAGTGKGVDRLDPATGRIKHFSTADGLAHGELRSAFRDRSGDLWFGTTQGLSRLTPTPGRPPARPTVLITDLKIFGKAHPVSQAGETRIQAPALDHSRNQLQVAFVGFNDEPEWSLRYTYKLEGAGSDWKEPDREHEANYPGLEPGHYKFLVKAVNSENQLSVTPAEIDFVVLPPFWRRAWFETLAAVLLVCLVFTAYRYRLQEITARVRLRYEERLDERTRIARELHDTLLQSLAGVSLHLDAVAKQIRPISEAAAAQIGGLGERVEASFREARQKVQDLRSPMLQGRALVPVMREALEQVAAGYPVRLRMTVAGQPRPVREEVEEAVLRIGQEAVANGVRHAHATEIEVWLAYDEGSLTLRIQDDGQGFDLNDPGRRVGHWGLRNMQERAHGIGAQWRITSAAGRGTGIETIVPLTGAKPR
ncbi:MAG: two-component regulator propeller domain-containing protein [Bryobacteraceae bacterium]